MSRSGRARSARHGRMSWSRSILLQSLLIHEISEGVDDKPVRLFGADGQSQLVRQVIVLQRAQNKAASGEEGIGLVGGLAPGCREVDQQEVADTRRHLQ